MVKEYFITTIFDRATFHQNFRQKLIFSCFINAILVNAVENDGYLIIDKIYADVDVNDDFDETAVIVILDSTVSQINKDHSSTIFKDINYFEIVDLTFVNDETTISDIENFEQILKIKLSNPGKENVINMIHELSLIEGVKYAGPNRYLKVEQLPNDPLYSSSISALNGQWAHDNIDSEYAWDFSTGNSDVRIGIIDSGVSLHEDLNANVAAGYDFTNMIDDETPGSLRDDVSGHGTHVAGIIGAVGNQAPPLGVVGVNWDITIVPMQVGLPDGSIDSTACVSAINFARELWNTEDRISILSMSISSNFEWPEIESAIRSYQGLFVCSTGNKEQDNDNPELYNFPSYYGSDLYNNPLPNLISVGRSDIDNERPMDNNANWGQHTISIYAPGQYVLSTYPELICENNDEIFYDGTRMCELSISNRTILYSYIDSGRYTLNEILMYFDLIFGNSPSLYATSHHHSDGYHYMTGSSMSTPYVAGVAALLLSLDDNLTAFQLKNAILDSAEEITIEVPDTSEDAEEGDTVEQDVLKLNSYNAVKYVLENYMNPTIYTLSNYSSTINLNKEITSDASYFDELNGFYKLNVTYSKNYEFISSSASGIEVTLYDEDFTEIPFNDLDLTTNIVHFIENLSTGTYYLRMKFTNEESIGTINTKIVSRTTAYVGVGDNDVLLNTHNFNEGIYPNNYYYYINSRGVGFYRFTLTGIKADGTTLIYPYSAIMIKNHMNEDIIDKYSFTNYSNQAISGYNENTFVAYLNSTGYFYVYVDIDTEGLKSLTLSIEPVGSDNLNLFNLFQSSNELISIINSNVRGDNFKKINLKETGKFTIEATYSGGNINDILFVLVKLNSNNNVYSLETKIIELMDNVNNYYTQTMILEDGVYYVGYFNKEDFTNFSVSFNRLVTQYGSDILVPDSPNVILHGSQINILEMGNSNPSYGETFITKGFTRLIYLDDNYGVSNSREDYYWYSSDESKAKVTQYGTVYGVGVGTVKIMAVLKTDPSKVFVKEFTIYNDDGTGYIPVETTINIKYSDTNNGTFRLPLELVNCPYPMYQYYSWSTYVPGQYEDILVTNDDWGNYTVSGPGTFDLVGQNYIYNTRYITIVVIIHINITNN